MIIMSLIAWDPCTETRLAPGEAGPGDWQQPCPVGAALQLRQEARAAVAEFNGQLRRPGQGRVEPVAAGAHHLRHGLSLAQPARQGETTVPSARARPVPLPLPTGSWRGDRGRP